MADLRTIILDLLRRAEIGQTQQEVNLSGFVPGMVVVRRDELRNIANQLQGIFQFDVIESNGKLTFNFRGVEPVASITADDMIPLRAQEGEASAETLLMTKAPRRELPEFVDIVYADKDQDYQLATQTAIRQTAPTTTRQTVQVNFVLTSSIARRAANRLIDAAWTEKLSFTFKLPITYARLEPGDVVNIVTEARTYTVRLVKSKYVGNGIEFEGIVTDSADYTQEQTGSTLTKTTSVALAQAVTVLAMDVPLVDESAPDTPGYFIGVGKVRNDTQFRFADMYESFDDVSYSNFATLTLEVSAYGTASTVLGDGQTIYIDNANTVDVLLTDGALAGVSELALLNGANAALLGDELIQFQNAELIATNTYRLSNLLRGRRGTEQHTGTHALNERFVLFGPEVLFTSIDSAHINALHYLKGVANGLTLDDTDEVEFTPTAANLKPFSPICVEAVRDDSENITLSWIRRGRVSNGWNDNADIPIGEDTESYEIDIMDGATVLRTITATSPTASYSAADQTTDFGSTQSSITVNIYQMSATVGRGFPATATV